MMERRKNEKKKEGERKKRRKERERKVPMGTAVATPPWKEGWLLSN